MDTLKVELAKKVIKIINEYQLWQIVLFFCALGVVLFLSGYIFHWIIKNKQIRSEIKKLISEAEKNAIDTAERKVVLVEKCQSYNKKYVEITKLLGISLRFAIDLMGENDLNKFDNQREEALSIFYSDYIQSFIEYSEIMSAVYHGKELNDFIENEIFPFLDTVGKFLININAEPILKKINRSTALIKASTLSRLANIAERSIPLFSFNMKKKYRIKLEQIKKYYE
jgi:hypothetical protein